MGKRPKEQPTTVDNSASTGYSSWRSLFEFTKKKHVPTLILGIFLTLAASLVPSVLAVLFGRIFNAYTDFGAGDISGQKLVENVTSGCVGLVSVGAASWVLNGAYFSLFVLFGELQTASARETLFGELLKRNLEWFEMQQDGTGAFLSSLQA